MIYTLWPQTRACFISTYLQHFCHSVRYRRVKFKYQWSKRPRDRDTGLWPGQVQFGELFANRISRFRDRVAMSQRVQRPKQLSFSQPDSVSLVLLKSGPTLCMSFALEKESRGAEESKSDFAPKKIRLRRFFSPLVPESSCSRWFHRSGASTVQDSTVLFFFLAKYTVKYY